MYAIRTYIKWTLYIYIYIYCGDHFYARSRGAVVTKAQLPYKL